MTGDLDNCAANSRGEQLNHSDFPKFDGSVAQKLPTYRHLQRTDGKEVYLPSDDTFLLHDVLCSDASTISTQSPSIIIELGPGSGVISTGLASRHSSLVTSIDLSPYAADFTRRTASENGQTLSVICGDLLTSVSSAADVIVFNPPYVPDEFDLAQPMTRSNALDFALVGGPDGRAIIDKALPMIANTLTKGGLLYLVAIEANGVQAIVDDMAGLGLDGVVVVRKRFDVETLVVIRAIRR